MSTSRLQGTALIAAGLSLFAALAYEPAYFVSFLGLRGIVSEAAVVLYGLTVSAVCAAGGVVALRAVHPR
ncbi:MAG: hypothetical protein IT162_07205 [Bryobacterales bacterium]|nr:hypothetical protein [Bryobacterales bacterium]